MPGQQTQRGQRFAASIKNQIRGIEIDLQIRAVNILEEIEQHLRWLLSGFEGERLAVCGGLVAYAPHHPAYRDVVGVIAIVRHESDVACYTAHAKRCGKAAP